MAKANNGNNTCGSERKDRQTPFDAMNEHNLAIPLEEHVPKELRGVTAEEIEGSNEAPYLTARRLFNFLFLSKESPQELKTMNQGKVGRPYTFSNSLILRICDIMSFLTIDFRTAAGIVAGILDGWGMKAPSYSRLYERYVELMRTQYQCAPVTDARILCMYVMSDPGDRVRRVAVDSTGLNLSNCTLWRLHKWGVGPDRRGWIKMHALTDIDTNEILAIVVTEEDTGDCGMLQYLMDIAVKGGVRFDTVYGDGAYGTIDNFELVCEGYGCSFVTSFKRNTVPRDRGCGSRGKAARLWCSLPYKVWVVETGYGRRWKVESAFSDFKRVITECVKARKTWRIAPEVVSKVRAFNIFKGCRNSVMRITGNGVVVS